MDDLRYRLALLRAPGLGTVGMTRLLARFASPADAVQCAAALTELPAETRAYLSGGDWQAEVDADLAWREGCAGHILVHGTPAYPARLATIPDPPPLLFVRGDPAVLDSPQLAVVGSRNPTPAGSETAHDFARHLAGIGLTITSGLALGIDAASHRGALAGHGQTIAVFGTGADRIYPAKNRDLAHAILAGGGVIVSEFPPGTTARPHHFPRRNRIISGLSLGTLVVEAAIRSGSLITARTAAEQGREVFAVPGSIHNPLARGCHRLIRDGAKLVETAQDILEELAPYLRSILAQTAPAPADTPGEASQETLDPGQRRLLECLDYGPTSVDVLVERSGLTAEEVSSMLLPLELEGYLTSTPGGYTRTSKRV